MQSGGRRGLASGWLEKACQVVRLGQSQEVRQPLINTREVGQLICMKVCLSYKNDRKMCCVLSIYGKDH